MRRVVRLFVILVLGSSTTTAAGLESRQEPIDGLEARLTLRACAAAVREESVRLCRQALELRLSPRRAAVAQRLLGRSLADLARWDEAVAAYREALRLEPTDAEAGFQLGLALLYGQGRPAEAEPFLREAVRSCPDQATSRVELAVALNALEQHAEAAAEFQQALALDDHALDSRPAAQATYLASLRAARWP